MILPALNAGFVSPCWQSSGDSTNAVHLEISDGVNVKYTGASARRRPHNAITASP